MRQAVPATGEAGGTAALHDSGFSILEDEIVTPATGGAARSPRSSDGGATFCDLSALRDSRLQMDYFVPEPEPELRRDMLGYVVEDDSEEPWQLSKQRIKAHQNYVDERNKRWAAEAGRDSAANLADIPLTEKQWYGRLYREGFFADDEPHDNPGHMQLLHDVTKGQRDDLVRKGVPPAGSWGRGRVWRLYSGAVTKQLEYPDMYASLREICEQQAQAERRRQPTAGSIAA